MRTATTPPTRNTLQLLLFMTAVLILLPQVMSTDQETYTTPGVSRDNTYQQAGSGVWTGRSATTYTLSQSMAAYTTPLVADLDHDGTNEIILTTSTTIEVRNFTTGIGLVLKDDYAYGSTLINNYRLISDPGLIDYDDDNYTEIIYYNKTGAFALNYSSGTLTLEQYTAYTLVNDTASPTSVTNYFPVKCTAGNTISSGNDSCVFIVTNRTGAGTFSFLFVTYDLDSGLMTKAVMPTIDTVNYQFQPLHNIHLADGDDDGYYEAYVLVDNAANGDAAIISCEIASTSCKVQQYDNRAVGTTYTDMIIARLDGVNEIATWAYMTSNVVSEKSVRLNTNVTLADAHCGTNCPKGNF